MDANRRDLLDGTARGRDLATIDDFLATLRAEQQRFLLAVEDVRCRLDQGDGQFAHVAAIHTRLTRQFFDAQRTLLRHRAEIEAQVAGIAATTEARADALVHAAREQAETGSVDVDVLQLPVSTAGLAVGSARTVRQQIALLGMDVVRTSGDVDAVREVLEGAFEPDDPDADAAELSLRHLLDGWWEAARQEGKALVDDAEARAAMRMHLAGLTALDTLASVQPVDLAATAEDAQHAEQVEPGEPGTAAPRLMEVPGLDTLQDRPAEEWGDALDELLNVLDNEAPAVPEAPSANRDLRIREEDLHVPPQEAFRRFWDAADAPVGVAGRPWSPLQLLVPVMGLSALVVAALAWVG